MRADEKFYLASNFKNLKHGPWLILERKFIYKNPWMEVIEDKVVRPDGKNGIYGFVSIRDGVAVLPVDEMGFVYLTEEFHYAGGKTDIEVVSGGIETGESSVDAAKKELLEELGIRAESFLPVGIIDPFTAVVKSRSHLFLASGLSFEPAQNEGTEIIKLKKMKFEEALKMVKSGEITHSPSCVLILLAQDRIKN